jgi:hypothetical protein
MRVLIGIAVLFLSLTMSAQEYAKWIELAEEAKQDEDFQGAVSYYSKAYALDSTRAELQYALAQAHEANHQYRDALQLYHRVYRKDRGRFYPDGPYHLAEMYMYLGEYEEALDYWKRALRTGEPDDSMMESIAQSMRSCEYALLHPDEKEEWKIEQLGPRINGPESDFAAFMLADSSLLFSSLRGPYTSELELEDPEHYRIQSYRSTWSGDTWKRTDVLKSKHLDPTYNYVNPVLDPAGKYLYISRCEDLHRCVIGRFEWKDSIASPFEELKGEINQSSGTQTHPFLIDYKGEEILLFSSDRAVSMGGMDIWSAREKDGTWNVKNLGPAVNSAGNEISPSYDSEESLLYFSSDSYPGYGGFDVFSIKGTPDVFSAEVENLGTPLNSSLNDLYFRWQGDMGFLSSNRSSAYSIDGSQCCNDLFLVTRSKKEELAVLEKDSLEHEPSKDVPDVIQSVSELEDLLPLSLYFHNDIPDPGSRALVTSRNYASTLSDYLGMRQEYIQEYKMGLSPPQAANARAQMEEFFDASLVANLEILDDVTKLLLGELQKDKIIEIAIKGYASPLAQNDYNKLLTERRINSVINYFKAFENGALLPYLAPTQGEAHLLIKKIPYGEERSEKEVSDNPQDRQNSVFSISAARERRVEILRISELD